MVLSLELPKRAQPDVRETIFKNYGLGFISGVIIPYRGTML